MSCWVVPSLAAELWHIPLDQVWRRIRAGEIAIKEENGFTFVDVAPYGTRVTKPNLPPAERPSTFEPAHAELVTVPAEAELAAVTEDEAAALVTADAPAP